MTTSREDIYAALLTQLETAGTTFQTYTRRWKSTWDDPAARLALLPMLVQWEQMENVIWGNRGIGPLRTLEITLELYAKIPDVFGTPGVPDKTTSGSSVLNPLIDAVEAALQPPAGDELQTLGGLVFDCRLEGAVIKVMGDEDPSGLCGALVPVRILIP